MSFSPTTAIDQTYGLIMDASTYSESTTNDDITWLGVPYREKDEAKACGAQWDSKEGL